MKEERKKERKKETEIQISEGLIDNRLQYSQNRRQALRCCPKPTSELKNL
jgi:hypothetical protein